jgi:hypothetical protein
MRILTCLIPIILLLTMIGCQSSTDDRLVELAREHAERQAESQRQMTDLQKQVAAGSRQLVEADAKARGELTSLQHDLRSDQADIGHERDKMEAERREIAANRYRDPIVAAFIMDIGIVLACLLPLIVAVYVLWSARRAGESDSAVAELLVQELIASEPMLLFHDRSSFPRLDNEAADPLPGGNSENCDQPAS